MPGPQFAICSGIAIVGAVMLVILVAETPRGLKADKQPVQYPPRVVRLIPIDRRPKQEPGAEVAPEADGLVPPEMRSTFAAFETPTSKETATAEPKAPEPEPEIEEPASRHNGGGDICARTGGRKVDFYSGRRLMWRCAYARH
jgi:hypothetical protein